MQWVHLQLVISIHGEATLKQGLDKVYENTINGKGGMPPKGGSSLSDDEVKVIVDYMIEASK